jgi:hypothetical protein
MRPIDGAWMFAYTTTAKAAAPMATSEPIPRGVAKAPPAVVTSGGPLLTGVGSSEGPVVEGAEVVPVSDAIELPGASEEGVTPGVEAAVVSVPGGTTTVVSVLGGTTTVVDSTSVEAGGAGGASEDGTGTTGGGTSVGGPTSGALFAGGRTTVDSGPSGGGTWGPEGVGAGAGGLP